MKIKHYWTFIVVLISSVVFAEQNMVVHTVKSGESIMTISYKYYGTHQKWREIISVNPDIDPMKMSIGQKISIPNLGKKVVEHKPVVKKKMEEKASNKSDVMLEAPKVIIVPKKKPKVVKKKVVKVNKKPSSQMVVLQKDQHDKELSNLRKVLEARHLKVLAQLKKEYEEKIAYLKVEKQNLTTEFSEKEQEFYKNSENEENKFDKLLAENKKLRRDFEKMKDRYQELEENNTEIKEKHVQALNVNSELQSKLNKVQDRKISSINVEDSLVAAQKEYDRLYSEFLQVKESNIELQAQLKDYKITQKKLESAVDRNEDFKSDIKDLTKQLISYKKNYSEQKESHPLYIRSILAKAQSDVAKEKAKLIADKLWVEKNKGIGKCSISLDSKESSKVAFRDTVLYLNDLLGSDNVTLSRSEDELVFKLPGDIVWGVESPTIASRHTKMLYELSSHLNKLPIEQINIVGHSKYVSVKNKKQQSVDADTFILGQSIRLQKYFVDELGWRPSQLLSSTAGFDLNRAGMAKKEFEFRVQLKKRPQRKIASIIKHDKLLSNIGQELLQNLSEPKFSKVDINNKSININLGRHYFFGRDKSQLTNNGKQYIDKLVEMSSQISDAQFVLKWVPGRRDNNFDENSQQMMRELASVKNYIAQRHAWVMDKIDYAFANRHHAFNDGSTYLQDKYNNRLVFRVIPVGINIQKLDELNEK